MGELNLIFIFVILVGLVVGALMFVPKKQGLNIAMSVVSTLWSLVITWINVTAIPSNMMSIKLVPAAFGLASAIGLVMFFALKSEKQKLISKIIIALGLALGLCFMIFY